MEWGEGRRHTFTRHANWCDDGERLHHAALVACELCLICHRHVLSVLGGIGVQQIKLSSVDSPASEVHDVHVGVHKLLDVAPGQATCMIEIRMANMMCVAII